MVDRKTNHKHGGIASNTNQTFKTFIGCTVKGIIELRQGVMMVFDCGWALNYHTDNGAHWIENPETVQRELQSARERLQDDKEKIEGILGLAGEK